LAPGKPIQPNSDLVTFPAQPHALPFRTILGEYYERRPDDLAKATAGIPEIQALDPFNEHDKHFESVPGKFRIRQWRLLEQQIQNSENAYRALAAQKEVLAAISAEDFLAAGVDHRRKINELEREWSVLDKEINSAPAERKPELGTKKKALLQKLDDEHASKKRDVFQRQIIVGYQKVLAAESKCKQEDQPLLRVLHGMKGSAVCLSGGGIRSASFCLGVLQGLARFSVKRAPKADLNPLEGLGNSALEKLDYLSTVSGGGYIGSWLMAWATHAQYKNVVQLLARPAETAADPEPQPIRHLREYTSYLTPRYGFTLDTMTLLAIVLRNLILNWMILVPAVVVLFCLPEFFYQLSAAVALVSAGWVSNGSVVVASIIVSWGTLFVALSTFKPYYASETKNPQNLGRTSREIFNLVLPLTLAAWILAEGWAWVSHNQPSLKNGPLFDIARHFAWFAILPIMAMAVARIWRFWPRLELKNPSPLRRQPLLDADDSQDREQAAAGDDPASAGYFRWAAVVDWGKVSWALIAPFLIGILLALALAACAKYIPLPDWSLQPKTYQQRGYVWLCVPVIWSLLLLASTLLSGLLSGIESEEEREWWARAGGLMIMVELGWLALIGVAFYAGVVVSAAVGGILAAAGLASGYVGSLAGLSAATSSGLKKVKLDQLSTAQKWLSKYNLIAPVACALAIVCIAFALAGMTSGLRDDVYASLQSQKTEGSAVGEAVRSVLPALHVDTSFLNAPPVKPRDDQSGAANQLKKDFIANLVIALIAFLIAVLANECINVNTFSLHGMYRMRLTRAYLGASNFARHADNFTDFDPHDNFYEKDVVYHGAPLHIINTSLNVVATSNLAWQQRKAESFTFSPLSVGSWRLGYLPTSLYGGSKGVKLGTAMSISGAAFNPNMGYHSSPLVTLLMTFFNARLGWWLPNPIWPVLKAQESGGGNSTAEPITLDSLLESRPRTVKYLRRESPVRALVTLIYEALGRTDDKYKWIELTDGGHFENLGLYEMVMRRCHYIIVVDSDADGDCEFEDLGNAVRKIEIDFGVPIRFPKYPKGLPMKRGIDGSNVYYAVGDILYDRVDSTSNSSGDSAQQGIPNGTLLYIKPCLNGSEPLGVRAYSNAHPKFPHESTANQFFNEPQFESYRNLGSWEFASIVNEFSKDTPPPGNDLDTLFEYVTNAAPAAAGDGTDAGLWGALKSALGWFKEGPSKTPAPPSDEKA
jgi:hypothetical protein